MKWYEMFPPSMVDCFESFRWAYQLKYITSFHNNHLEKVVHSIKKMPSDFDHGRLAMIVHDHASHAKTLPRLWQDL